jgi:cobalt-precorrin 5A hydrolase
MIAIGIGCRRGTPAAAIELLVREALAGVGSGSVCFGFPLRETIAGRQSGLCAGSDCRVAVAPRNDSGGGGSGVWGRLAECDENSCRVPTSGRPALFSIEDKADEAGLIEAARHLGLNLVFLARDALRAQAHKIQSASTRSETMFGVPSVAEAAALAGAGVDAALIVPRIAREGVTCAVAAA